MGMFGVYPLVINYCYRVVPAIKRRFILMLGAVVLFTVTGCSETSQPTRQLPKLLEKVSAGGYGACPPRNEAEKKILGIGLVEKPSEFDQRLMNEFPTGSNGYHLIKILVAQGFNLNGHCKTDPTIRKASFFQRGKGFLPYDISAWVYWKIDDQNRVLWVKGSVGYSGL